MDEGKKDKSASDDSLQKEERWTPSKDELLQILKRHQKWLDTSGAEGEKANLMHAHLEEAYLGGAHLQRAFLGGIHLEEAYLAGAHLQGAFLGGAHLEEAFLAGVHLEEANLAGAHLEEAYLAGAHLEEAGLAGAHLQGANLMHAHLEEAYLTDAHLQGVIGLQARQLRGAYVSNARLPEAIARFDGLSIVKEASQSARKLFISVLVACAYSAITVATKGAGGDEVTLPIVAVDIGVGSFYLVTSILLALLFGYFHLQMQRLWEEIAELPAIFPDGRPLDKKIHPWPITGIVRAHVKFLKGQSNPPFFPLQRGVAVLLAWGLVPLSLGYFAYMYSLNYGRLGSAFLFGLAALTTSWAIASYRKAAHTLELKAHRPLCLRSPASPEKGKWFLKSPSFWISVGLLILAGIAWYARYYWLLWG